MSEPDADARIALLEQENARLRALLEQGGMPSALRHQVRNVLGVLRAMMRRSAETAVSLDDYVAHLEGRFDALLRVQALVLSGTGVGVDLHTLVANELLAHVVRDGEKARISGPDIRLATQTAEVLGLVVHELVTNAIKFGSLPTSDGTVSVTWTTEPDGSSLLLAWRETGGDVAVQAPLIRGFGTEAIEIMLPYQLKAESRLEFRPDGLICTIRLPVQGEAAMAWSPTAPHTTSSGQSDAST